MRRRSKPASIWGKSFWIRDRSTRLHRFRFTAPPTFRLAITAYREKAKEFGITIRTIRAFE